jgi:hypothetical protein
VKVKKENAEDGIMGKLFSKIKGWIKNLFLIGGTLGVILAIFLFLFGPIIALVYVIGHFVAKYW